MINQFALKILNTLLCISLVFPGLAGTVTPIEAKPLWPQSFEADFGRTIEVIPPANGNWNNVIYHIQDTHCNIQAQKNIPELLDRILKTEKVRLVCVEGAYGAVNADPVSQAGTAQSRSDLCQEYIQKGLLTGVETLKIQKPNSFELFGIETPRLYLNNFQAFKDTIDSLNKNRGWIKQYRKFIQKLKNTLFNGPLLDLDQLQQNYTEKEIEKGEFILSLQSIIENLPSSDKVSDFVSTYENKQNFVNFKSMYNIAKAEKSVNFNKMEEEFNHLSSSMQTSDNPVWLKFNRGEISKSDLYLNLQIDNYLPAHIYPQLTIYATNLVILKGINTESLLPEIRSLMYQLKQTLATNELEERLVELDTVIVILEKLIGLNLPLDEWEFIKQNQVNFEIGSILKESVELAERLTVKWPESLENAQYTLESAVAAAKRYYVYLHQRDHAMVRNMFEKMRDSNFSKSVLIAGGFHTEGIRKLVMEKGWGMVTLRPKVGPQSDLYYEIMMDKDLNLDAAFESFNSGLARALILDFGLGLNSGIIFSEMIAKLKGPDESVEGSQDVIDSFKTSKLTDLQIQKILQILQPELDNLDSLPHRVQTFITGAQTELTKIKSELLLKKEKSKSKNTPGIIAHNYDNNSCYVATMLNMVADVPEMKNRFRTVEVINEASLPLQRFMGAFFSAVTKVETGQAVTLPEIKVLQQLLKQLNIIGQDSNTNQDPSSVLQALLNQLPEEPLAIMTQTSFYKPLIEEEGEIVELTPQKIKEAIIIKDLNEPQSIYTISQSMFIQISGNMDTLQEGINEALDVDEDVEVIVHQHIGDNRFRKFKAVKNKTTRRIDNLPRTLYLERSSFGYTMNGFQEYVKVKDASGKDKVYRLKKIACHSGGLYSGHETAYVKRGEEWFFSDDLSTKIESVDISDSRHTSKILSQGRTFIYESVEDEKEKLLTEKDFSPYMGKASTATVKTNRNPAPKSKNSPGVIAHNFENNSCYVAAMINMVADVPEMKEIFRLKKDFNQSSPPLEQFMRVFFDAVEKVEKGESVTLDEIKLLQKWLTSLKLIGKDKNTNQDPASILQELLNQLVKSDTLPKLTQTSTYESLNPDDGEIVELTEKSIDEAIIVTDLDNPQSTYVSPQSMFIQIPSNQETLQKNLDESFTVTENSEVIVHQHIHNNQYKKFKAKKNKTTRSMNVLPKTLYLERSSINNSMKGFQEYVKVKDASGENKIYRLKKITCHSGGAYSGHETAYVKRGEEWFFSDDLNMEIKSVDIVLPYHTSKILEQGRTFIYEAIGDDVAESLDQQVFQTFTDASVKMKMLRQGLVNGLAYVFTKRDFNETDQSHVDNFLNHPSPWTIRQMGIQTSENLEEVISKLPDSEASDELILLMRKTFSEKIDPNIARLIELKSGLSKAYFSEINIPNEAVQNHINAQMKNIDRLIDIINYPNNNGYDRVVIFPSSARGDMNAYKYISYLENKDKNTEGKNEKIFTIVMFQDIVNDEAGLEQNSNMSAFMQHLESEPNFDPDSFLYLPKSLTESNFSNSPSLRKMLFKKKGGRDGQGAKDEWGLLKGKENSRLLIDYDVYDGVVYNPEIIKKIQADFVKTAQESPSKEVIAQFNKELGEKFEDHNKHLVIINVNGRIDYSKPYDPRNQRHSLDPLILREMIETAVKNGCAVMLIGDAVDNSLDDIKDKYVDGTQLWNKKLNRHQQRASIYAVTTGFTSSLYFGMQSGVNEDAVLLHNTNVFSLSEKVGKGQVGRDRVQKKMNEYSKEREISNYNNFFAVENTALLTARGRLAAFQLQANMLARWKMTHSQFIKEDTRHLDQQTLLTEDEYPESWLDFHARNMLDPEFDEQSDDEDDFENPKETVFVTRGGVMLTHEHLLHLEQLQLKNFKELMKKSNGIYVSKRGTPYKANNAADEEDFQSLRPKSASKKAFHATCQAIIKSLQAQGVLDGSQRLMLNAKEINERKFDFSESDISIVNADFEVDIDLLKKILIKISETADIITKTPIHPLSSTANTRYRNILRKIDSYDGDHLRKMNAQTMVERLIHRTLSYEANDPKHIRFGTPHYRKNGNIGLFVLIRNMALDKSDREPIQPRKDSNPSGTLRPTGKSDAPAYLIELARLKGMEAQFLLKFKQNQSQAQHLGDKNFVIEFDFGDESNIPAYNFIIGENQHLIVLNSNDKLKEKIGEDNLIQIQEEALYHEQHEVRWMDVLMKKFGNEDIAHRWSHIISSSMQVSQYGKKGLTPFHELDLAQKSTEELEALIREYHEQGRQEQHDVINWAILNAHEMKNGYDVNLDDIKKYEERYIRAAKEMLLAKLNPEVTQIADLAQESENSKSQTLKTALGTVKMKLQQIETQEDLLRQTGLTQTDLEKAYSNLEKRLYTMSQTGSKETRTGLTRVGWYLGKENQIGFDESYLNALLTQKELLAEALLKAGLESVSSNINADKLDSFFDKKTLNLYERSFQIIRQLGDLVPSDKRIEFQQNVFALIQKDTVSDEEYLKLFGNLLENPNLDFNLLDSILRAIENTEGRTEFQNRTTNVLFMQLYQEIASITKEESTVVKDRKLKAILKKLGLGQYEIDSTVSALRDLLNFSVYDSVKNQLDVDESGRLEAFLGLLGARLLNGKYINTQARKAAIESFVEVFNRWASNELQQDSRLSRAFTRAMNTDNVFLTPLTSKGIKPETARVFERLESQNKKWQEVMQFLESGDKTYTSINKVSLVKKENKTYLCLNMGNETIEIEQNELLKEKGRSLKEIIDLHAVVQKDPSTTKAGIDIRKEVSNVFRETQWNTLDRKALLMVSADYSQEELSEIMNFIKQMKNAKGISHIKLFGDALAFIDTLDQLGMLQGEIDRELLINLFIEEDNISAYQNNTPLVIMGKGTLANFKELKKSVYLDSTMSLNGSILGAISFLTQHESLLNQLESQIEETENKSIISLLKTFVNDTSDTKIAQLQSPLIFVIPAIKPLLETLLTQLGNEEETVLIAG